MPVTVTLHASEAVFTCGAIETTVEKTRRFLLETDHKYGKMNSLHRESIAVLKSAHATLVAELRKSGYPMTGRDLADKEGDTVVGGNLFEPEELEFGAD